MTQQSIARYNHKQLSRELRSAAALMVYSHVKHVRMDALRVLSSKMCMDACVKFEDQVRIEKYDGVPAIFCTLPADCISKEIGKHDGMPTKFLERKT